MQFPCVPFHAAFNVLPVESVFCKIVQNLVLVVLNGLYLHFLLPGDGSFQSGHRLPGFFEQRDTFSGNLPFAAIGWAGSMNISPGNSLSMRF